MSDSSQEGAFQKLLVINGSLGGSTGNTGQILGRWTRLLQKRFEVEDLQLATSFPEARSIAKSLARADAFIFATGTYWDSWGSPLQRFFETLTDFEGTEIWLGKPAAALVTMHSVGGKEVLSRLQGVLVTLGLHIPPMSGMTLSLANQLASRTPSDFADDFWQQNDLEVITHNLAEALEFKNGKAPKWKSWNVDRQDPSRRWVDLNF